MFWLYFHLFDVLFTFHFLNFILTDLIRLNISDAKTLLNWQMFNFVCNDSNSILAFDGVHVNFGFT